MRVGECISEEYNKICTVMASRASVCEERNRTLQFQRCDSAVKRLDHADRGVKQGCIPSASVSGSVAGGGLPGVKLLYSSFSSVPSLIPDCRVLRREYVNQIGIMSKKREIFSCMKYFEKSQSLFVRSAEWKVELVLVL